MFMKRQFPFLWVAFVTLIVMPGCGPYIPSSQAPGSALVRVECNNASVRQILELLRSGRGKDIHVSDDGDIKEVTAAFNPADTPPRKLAQIMHDLNDLGGVLHAEVVENPHPV